MTDPISDMDLDFQRDLATVATVAGGILRLGELRRELDQATATRTRGYFTPDEDDRVRRLLTLYRNHRIALFEVIHRCQHFADMQDPVASARTFLLGYCAAVMLYNWSNTLVRTYQHDPVVRVKLNEPDSRFGIEANLFETIYESLTSTRHLRQLHSAAAHFETNQATFEALVEAEPDLAWLLEEVRRQHGAVKQDWGEILSERLQREVKSWGWTARAELHEVGYKFSAMVLDWIGNIYVDAVPRIPRYHITRMRRLMQPGDIIFVRPERKSSTILIPGWWTHAAVYFGGPAELEALNARQLPNIAMAWPQVIAPSGGHLPAILEAMAAGVVVNPIEKTLNVDHVAVFRPRIGDDERRLVLDTAFGHLGKQYDFELDFTRSNRLVCTEVVYRSYHGIGPLHFDLVARFGRPTLTADDLVRQITQDQTDQARPAQMDFVAASMRDMKSGRSHLVLGDEGLAAVRATVA